MRLETPRLVIRQWRAGDAPALSERILEDPLVTQFQHSVSALAHVRDDVLDGQQHPPSGPYGVWALVSPTDDEVIGWCFLQPLEGSDDIEMGYGLARSAWGRGLATEAARAVLRYAFEELELDKVVAVVGADNPASIRVLEKIGMQRERTMDWPGHGDVLVFERLRDAF